jgi:hypothetical protein
MAMSTEIYGYCQRDGMYIRTSIRGEDSFALNQRTIQSLTAEEKPYSECARFGYRRLLAVLPEQRVVDNLFDRNNIQGFHEHLFWDASGDNVGFFPNKKEDGGLFAGLISSIFAPGKIASMPKDYFSGYSYDPTCYNGRLMRAALSQITENPRYNLGFFNCQDFASLIRERYRTLTEKLK